MNTALGTRDQEKVPPSTVGDGGVEGADVVVMILGDLSELVIIETKKGLDSSPVATVGPAATVI